MTKNETGHMKHTQSTCTHDISKVTGCHCCCLDSYNQATTNSKTCLKRPLKNKQNKSLKDKW